MAAGLRTGAGTGTRTGTGSAGLGIPAHLALSFSSMEETGSSSILRPTGMRPRHRAAAGEGAPAVAGLRGRRGREGRQEGRPCGPDV